MGHPLHSFLDKAGLRVFAHLLRFRLTLVLLALTSYWLVYGLSVLLVRSMSLTWIGLFLVPAVIVIVFIASLVQAWLRQRDPIWVARRLEELNPHLQLRLRTGLDFLAGRVDHADSPFREAYLEQICARLDNVVYSAPARYPFGHAAILTFVCAGAFWAAYGQRLSAKYTKPTLGLGQTHLDLGSGSITIFEPEYTQIPGRTLPLKPGTYNLYPGGKLRMLVNLPDGAEKISLEFEGKEQKPVPLTIDAQRVATYDKVLVEPTAFRVRVDSAHSVGRSSPFKFEVKTDEPPEVALRSYTPEGPIDVMDPLIAEFEVKDDFGIRKLEAVVTWEGGEKRLAIEVPPTTRDHFILKRQWFLSDFQMGDVDSFALFFEAADNNPVKGPGIGRSNQLHYELESPDKKYQEFMKEAKELLDAMAGVLGDNLETSLTEQYNRNEVGAAEDMGQRISHGLYRSLSLTNGLIAKIRETPNLSRLDQTFLQEFRAGVSDQARARAELSLFYRALQQASGRIAYRDLLSAHRSEELGVEGLTYDLLLQLKMWAVFELERQNNELQNSLEEMEDLLKDADKIDQKQLQEMFDKLMNELMKDFQKMMSTAAKQMDMSMQEFMNEEALKDQKDMLDQLRKEIMEALKKGDMAKARALMEELKAQMKSAFQSMQEAMGEMSPEMQAMMKDMKELMGLLRELKSGQEGLESQTRNLKSELDKKMGGNDVRMGDRERQQHVKVTERIRKQLQDLYNKLIDVKPEELSQDIIGQIAEMRDLLNRPGINNQERMRLAQGIAEKERLLDYLSRDGLDKMQELSLRGIEQTDTLQQYLDQGELDLSLESGFKLDGTLLEGKRLSERIGSGEVRDKARPRETFDETERQLREILDALQSAKGGMEENRAQFMQRSGEKRQTKLSKDQGELKRMIEEFIQRTKDNFGGSQVGERLQDIGRSMDQAGDQLRNARLEAGLNYEQEALQKIGEMLEQLQQSSQPNGGSPNSMRMSHSDGQTGDPNLEDIYIPDSVRKANRDRMKEEIRERLQKNLPDAYGKEIRKYYEKLMDQ